MQCVNLLREQDGGEHIVEHTTNSIQAKVSDEHEFHSKARTTNIDLVVDHLVEGLVGELSVPFANLAIAMLSALGQSHQRPNIVDAHLVDDIEQIVHVAWWWSLCTMEDSVRER